MRSANRTGDHTPASRSGDGVFTPSVPARPAVPGYELLTELGRGGMGVVYRARDLRLNREVALKMILRADTGRVAVARFWAEAEVMAAVRHPHVVQVFELGDHGGNPYMVMELVTGGSLADRLRTGPAFAPRAAAELVVHLAGGVAAAHHLGIVHRDLKPGNVLLTPEGGPKVTDFGLAKRHAHDLTATQAVMGTPAYMSPEQAAGRAKFVGPQSDVWALGVILYECLAGQRPFEGDTVASLLSQIQSVEPATLRSRAPGVSRDLETVAAKCLAKEPEHRYPTAAELAGDLRHVLHGEPISARPVNWAERWVRWARRRPAAAAAYGLTLLAVALGSVLAVVLGLWREAETARGESRRLQAIADEGRLEERRLRTIADGALLGESSAKQEVERQREKLAQVNYGRTVQVAYQAYRDNDLANARGLLNFTRPELRGWEYGYVRRLCQPELVSFEGHAAGLTQASWSPDETRVLTGCSDGTARIWDAASGKALHELVGHPNTVNQAVWSPDGRRVATSSPDRVNYARSDGPGNATKIWSAETGALLFELKGYTGSTVRIAWHPDGSKIVTASYDRTSYVWDSNTGRLLHKLDANAGAFEQWNREGSRFLTVGGNRAKIFDTETLEPVTEFGVPSGNLQVAACDSNLTRVLTFAFNARAVHTWSVSTRQKLGELSGHTANVVSATWSPDGMKIATVCEDKTIRIWDAKTARVLRDWHLPELHTYTLWSPDGSRVATWHGGAKEVAVWDATTGRRVSDLVSHAERIHTVQWNRAGTNLLTASRDHTARVWPDRRQPPAVAVGRAEDAVYPASWSPDGKRVLATTTGGGRPRVWNAEDGTLLAEFPVPVGPSNYAAWNPDGSTVLIYSGQNLYVWDPDAKRVVHDLKGHTARIYGASWSPDGRQVLSTGEEGMIQIWDARTGSKVRGIGSGALTPIVSWSPDGSRIATSSSGAVHIWDAKTGAERVVLKGHAVVAIELVWSPDGTKMATTSLDKTTRVWDLAGGTTITELSGMCRSLSWSPDGSTILSTADHAIRLWDATTGRAVTEFEGHRSLVQAVEWGPDQRSILSTGTDNTVRLWDVSSATERLCLPCQRFAHFSPDGRRILTREVGRNPAVIYRSQ